MAAGTTVTIVPCGAMTADLTWLLLKPGRSITDRNHKDARAPWVDVPDALRARRDARRAAAVGHQLPARLGGALGRRPGCRTSSPTTRSPRTSTSTRGCNADGRRARRDRLRRPVAPALRPRRQRADVQGHQRQAGLQRARRRTSRSASTALFNGAHLKTDYEGLEFETVSGDTEFLPGVTLHGDPGPHRRLHVDAGRAARHRHHDLHFGRGLHGRQLRPARHARRHRQQPRAVVLARSRSCGASRSGPARPWSSATTPSRSTSCGSRRRSLHMTSTRPRAHRGDDLHLGRAAAEVRRGRHRRDRVRPGRLRRAAGADRHRPRGQRARRAAADRGRPQALRHRGRDLRRRARRADRRLA